MFAQEDFSPEDEVGDDAEDGHEDDGVGHWSGYSSPPC